MGSDFVGNDPGTDLAALDASACSAMTRPASVRTGCRPDRSTSAPPSAASR